MASDPLRTVYTTGDFVRLVAKTFAVNDEKIDRLLKDTEITLKTLNNPQAKTTLYDSRKALENLNNMIGEDWVFKDASIWNLDMHGATATAFMNAPTIRDAMDLVMKFSYLSNPGIYYERREFDEKLHYSYGYVLDACPGTSTTLLEVLCMTTFKILDLLLDGDWPRTEAWFSYPKPSYVHLYKNVLKGKLTFDKNYCSFIFPVDVADRVLPFADIQNFNQIVSRLFEGADEVGQEDPFLLTIAYYLKSIHHGRPNVDQAAEALRLSRRTLNRKLTARGTTFREMLETSLQGRAELMLSDNKLSRADIAQRLGYQDQTSLSRAMKRWRGK